MTGLVRFDLINYADKTKASLYSNHIPPIVSASRRKCHLIEACCPICPCYNFLPFSRGDLVSHGGIVLEKVNDFEPRYGYGYNDLTFRGVWTRDYNSLKQQTRTQVEKCRRALPHKTLAL